MIPVRLYDRQEDFAEMMAQQMRSSLQLEVRPQTEEPLLLDIVFDASKKDERAQISLHNTYTTYMRTGDLNTAVDYLNASIRVSLDLKNRVQEIVKLDPAYIYPAIRDSRYVDEAGAASGMLGDACLLGLKVVYLEIKNGYSKVISKALLEHHSRLSEERVRRIAYRNLKSEGWTPPKVTLPSPFRESCHVEAYMDNEYPVECQFLQPDLARAYLPANFLLAFPNRKYTLLMRSEERMDTMEQALRLARKARFHDAVWRNHRLMPDPVSDRIYWAHEGRFEPLDSSK